jgi:hypothetical protein
MPPPADLLRAGKCTGALTFPGADGVRKLQVRWGTRGRGLFAADAFKHGDIVTTVAGEVVDSGGIFGHEVWHISKRQCFVMSYALLGADSGLGIIANTAGGSGMQFASHQLLLQLLLLFLLLLVVVVLFFLRLISSLICFLSHR